MSIQEPDRAIEVSFIFEYLFLQYKKFMYLYKMRDWLGQIIKLLLLL